MKHIILTAPNFSEGRDQEKIQKILDCFRNREHVQILRWQGDPDHNRFGANVIGAPEAIYEAMPSNSPLRISARFVLAGVFADFSYRKNGR